MGAVGWIRMIPYNTKAGRPRARFKPAPPEGDWGVSAVVLGLDCIVIGHTSRGKEAVVKLPSQRGSLKCRAAASEA